MRLLLIFVYCGVLGATPLIEENPAPLEIQPLLTSFFAPSLHQAPDANIESLENEELDAAFLVQDAKMLEIAFLAGYPAGSTLKKFQSATRGNVKMLQESMFDRLPLNSAGTMLSAGSGVFFLLMIGVALLEKLRLAVSRP